jgi:hypothetical protein
MRKTTKIATSVLLAVMFIALCATVSAIGFFALWLHTYNVFTERRLVAEVTISQSQTDENGEYAMVTYKPVQYQSALLRLIFGDNQQEQQAQPTEYKIYGDTVHIGGPMVRFYNHLVLFNFKTVYKVGKIYGRYNFDNNKEINRKVISSFDLNGGIDPTWRDINERLVSWPYNMFVDTTQLSTPGVEFSKTRSKKYNLYITVDGFLWDLQPNQ